MSRTEHISSRTPAKEKQRPPCWRAEPSWPTECSGCRSPVTVKGKSQKAHRQNVRQTTRLLTVFSEGICTLEFVLSALFGVPWWPPSEPEDGLVGGTQHFPPSRSMGYRCTPKPGYQSSPVNTRRANCERLSSHLASWARIQRLFLLAFFPLVTEPHVFPF